MGYSKVNNKQLSNEVVNPFAQELILAVNSNDGTGIRAFGIDTQTDLGVFYSSSTATGSIIRIRELNAIRAIAVMSVSGNYVDIVDVDTRTSKYTLPTFNNRVYDVAVIGNYLIFVGAFTNYFKVIDLTTKLEITGFPSFDGEIRSIQALPDGRLVIWGRFTNYFKVIDFYKKQEITGYPTYNFSLSAGNFRNELEITNGSEAIILYRENNGGNEYFVALKININTKLEMLHSPTGVYNTTDNPLYWDGNRFRGGGSNTITQNELNINSSGGGSGISLAEAFLATWSVSNKARSNRYVRKPYTNNLYKYTYDGTTAVTTLTFACADSEGYNKHAIVTDLLKS